MKERELIEEKINDNSKKRKIRDKIKLLSKAWTLLQLERSFRQLEEQKEE